MTDKTDIAALRDKHELALKDLTERLTECNRLNFCMDELSAFTTFSSTVIDQLKAERQQRQAAEAELVALRGDQEPVANPVLAYADAYRAMARQGSGSDPIWGVITDLERNIAPLFTRQPKPVVVLPPRKSVNDYVDDEFTNADLAAIYDAARLGLKVRIQNAGIVVKDGE